MKDHINEKLEPIYQAIDELEVMANIRPDQRGVMSRDLKAKIATIVAETERRARSEDMSDERKYVLSLVDELLFKFAYSESAFGLGQLKQQLEENFLTPTQPKPESV